MAGGKETPRQKMIGMMYLVLTALLALQVGSAVLDKFAIINTTMEKTNGENIGKNNETLETIKKAAGSSENPKIKGAKDAAEKVRALTDKTYKNIDELKKKMIQESDGTEINEKLIQNHGSKAAVMMISKPIGKEYEKWLKDYVSELNSIVVAAGVPDKKYEDIAKAPKDLDLFKDNKDHANKDFLTFTFENTPVIAALASATESQAQILDYEKDALAKLAAIADAQTIKLDKFILMARPKSSIVAAGSKYEADLFITGSSTAMNPTFTKNGAALPVEEVEGIKMGKVAFNASASSYDKEGNSKQSYKVSAKLGDKDILGDIEYIVAKPVIKVTTGTAPTLYMGCGNSVNFEVPALGTNYKPSFSASGGKVIPGSKTGNVIIIPSQRKVNVTVTNAGANLGVEAFDVKPVPRPRIIAKDNNGRDIDLKNGIKAGSIAGLRVNAEAEANFKTEVPKDANYRVRNMSVILARGTARVQERTVTSESIDLTAWRALMRPGDRIAIEPKSVVRMTYEGTPEPVTVSSADLVNIPIN
ncbi:MAG: gliding motility protein GldM [Cyclobacteriaceae bacterium]